MNRSLMIAVLFLTLALLVLTLSTMAAGAELSSHLRPLPMSGEFAHTHFA